MAIGLTPSFSGRAAHQPTPLVLVSFGFAASAAGRAVGKAAAAAAPPAPSFRKSRRPRAGFDSAATEFFIIDSPQSQAIASKDFSSLPSTLMARVGRFNSPFYHILSGNSPVARRGW